MIAVEIQEPGGPEVLVPVERPMPALGPGDVLIKVAAAGVNRPDVLQRRGQYPVPPGESILVHGGASGIGTTAIQLARAFGARVFATAGTDEKCRACEALGAERAINYRRTDFVTAIGEATAGRGVDVVLDMVAGEYIPRDLETLATDGRLVIIGLQGGATAQINANAILRRRLTITGSTLRPRSVQEKGAIAKALREHVWPLLEDGAVRVLVHATFPLRNAAEAHRVMESSAHIGKLVLQVES